jgi:ABC-2 type transport system permease protein
VPTLAGKQPLAYMLIIPATVAAYAVAGERQQGTLEPVLTTPILAEFLLGKFLRTLPPVLSVSYVVFGVFSVAIELFVKAPVSAYILQPSQVVAE